MATKKAAKPARRKTAKKLKAVKKRSTVQRRTAPRKAVRKKVSKREILLQKMFWLCQRFANMYDRATFAPGTAKPNRPCRKSCRRHWTFNPFPVRPPGTPPMPKTEAPVSLSLYSNGSRIISTGLMLRHQADKRAAGWKRVYKEAQIMVN